MTENIPTYLQAVLPTLLVWIFIGIIGYEVFEKYLVQILKAQDNIFERFQYGTLGLAQTLSRYFDATDIEISGRINRSANWDNVAENVTTIEINRSDKPIIGNRIKIEKVTGAILGIIATGALMYGYAAQTMAIMSLLGLLTSTPAWLNLPPLYQSIIIGLGVIIANGLYVSDMISATNFTNSSRFNSNWKKIIFALRIVCIIFVVLAFSSSAIKDSLIGLFAYNVLLPISTITTLGMSLELITGLNIITSIPLYVMSFTSFISGRLISFAIQFVLAIIYLLCLLFGKIIITPIKFISAALGNGKK